MVQTSLNNPGKHFTIPSGASTLSKHSGSSAAKVSKVGKRLEMLEAGSLAMGKKLEIQKLEPLILVEHIRKIPAVLLQNHLLVQELQRKRMLQEIL